MKQSRIFFIYTHDNSHSRFRNGLKANTELSYFGAQALKQAFVSVTFLKLQGEKQSKINKITSNDVVIGHFGQTFLQASERTNRLITFGPWAGHEDRCTRQDINCISFEEERRFYDKALAIILLTSEFNQRVYLDKRQNFWFDYFDLLKRNEISIRVVHQPIDLLIFPRIKQTYTTNNFLYVGNRNHMKCVEHSEKLIQEIGCKLHLFGTGERSLDNLDQDKARSLAQLADFFIQPGMWEAQCVSILEAAARGFIPVVSEETGYPYSHPYLLRYDDQAYNLKQLKALLALSSEERKELADSLYQQLIQDPHHNNWNQLQRVLVEEVKKISI